VSSDQANRNLAEALRRVALTTLVRNASDDCTIVEASRSAQEELLGSRLLVITISSFTFRLLTIFQVSEAQPTREYYTSGLTARSLDEAFAEIANMCCGALGRELSAQFKHLAMSIPYGLESQCARFLDELQPRFRASYDVTINNAARVRITLCLCCNRPVEFAAARLAEEDHARGELELF